MSDQYNPRDRGRAPCVAVPVQTWEEEIELLRSQVREMGEKAAAAEAKYERSRSLLVRLRAMLFTVRWDYIRWAEDLARRVIDRRIIEITETIDGG